MAENSGGSAAFSSTARAERTRRDAEAEPAVITAAEMSYDEQLRMRKRRYLLAMGMRIPLLLAAMFAALSLHLIWLMFVLLIISIPLPWVAVLIANDRPARKGRAVVVGAINHQRALPAPPREIVDGD